MKTSFGPWTTALDANGSAGLSTFWKRRMTMLFQLSSTQPVLSRRTVFLLVVASVTACALPTIQVVPAAAETADAQAGEQPAASRIFLNVFRRKDDSFESALIAADPATGKWQRLGEGNLVYRLRLSPDKQTLVLAKHEDGIWICAPQEGSEWKRVMFTGSLPLWSPDGKQIIASESKNEEGKGWRHSTWRCNVDGTELTRLPIPETDEVDDWSPDGKWIVTVSDRHPPNGSGYQLYVMHPDGTEEKRLTQEGLNCYPRFSPDSRSIVYTHQRKGQNSIRVVNIDGTGTRDVLKAEGVGSVEQACWSPDGKQLVVHCFDWELDEKGKKIKHAGNDHNDHLEIMDADGKNRRELRLEDLQPRDIGFPDWR
jgi:dipeptidyl aminopeptidase/acylaminoacyl peptidase